MSLGIGRIRRNKTLKTNILSVISVVAIAFAAFSTLFTPGTVKAQEWSAPRTVYIPETGQSLDRLFLDTWRNWGAASLGYPITPEFIENGHTVQYFDYARMEYRPDDPNGNVVHLAKIGRELKPVTVFRTVPMVPGARSGDTSTNQELALEMRAWLPLDSEYASKPNTDTWRYIPETRHSVQTGFKDFWEATGEDSYLGFPISEEYKLNGASYQVFERGQLKWTSANGVEMVPVGDVLAKRYKLDTSPTPQGNLPTYSEDLFIPPPPPEPVGEKWIEVNLSSQYLIAWQGNTSVNETYVSTGRPGFDTPTGTFFVLNHILSQTMEGVLGGEYYNVPDVPWVMYFTNQGHALHGTYWHSNFGATMSHGCVNLPMGFAEWLYYWAPDGMRVEIHY